MGECLLNWGSAWPRLCVFLFVGRFVDVLMWECVFCVTCLEMCVCFFGGYVSVCVCGYMGICCVFCLCGCVYRGDIPIPAHCVQKAGFIYMVRVAVSSFTISIESNLFFCIIMLEIRNINYTKTLKSIDSDDVFMNLIITLMRPNQWE